MAFKMKGFPKHKVKSAFKKNGVGKGTKDKKDVKEMSEQETKEMMNRNLKNLQEGDFASVHEYMTRKDSLDRGVQHLFNITEGGTKSVTKDSPAKSRKRKLKKGKLLKTENPDVAVTGGSIQEQINDLEDRIEFIMEGVERGTATRQQNKDIKAMEKRIATLRKQRDKDRDKYSQLNPRNPERD